MKIFELTQINEVDVAKLNANLTNTIKKFSSPNKKPGAANSTTSSTSSTTKTTTGGGSTTRTRNAGGTTSTKTTPSRTTTTTSREEVSGKIKMGKPSGPIQYNGKTVNPGDPEYAKASAALLDKFNKRNDFFKEPERKASPGGKTFMSTKGIQTDF